MGRSARSKAGLRVRQPLASVMVKTRSLQEMGYLELIRPQVLEELNIKELHGLEDDSYVYRQALEAADGQTEATLSVDHYWVAMEGGYAVVVDAQITPVLAEEGVARDVVHHIQNLRRDAQFELTDRIVTYFQAPDEIARVINGQFAAYIRQETLSQELVSGSSSDAAKSETVKVEKLEVTLGVKRV